MRMRCVTLAFFAMALVPAACAEDRKAPSRQPETVPEGSRRDLLGDWVLVAGRSPRGHFESKTGARITMLVSRHGASGRAACNEYFTEFEVQDGTLIWSGGNKNDMGCSTPQMEAEERYLGALLATSEFVRRSDSLILSGDGGELTFEAMEPLPESEFVGIRWQLEALLSGPDRKANNKIVPAILELRRDGTFSGTTGCRRFHGSWIENGDEVAVTEIANEGNCPTKLRAQDTAVGVVVGDYFTVEVDGDRATLTDARGHSGLVYRARD
jgi:heat shock protein HslJ